MRPFTTKHKTIGLCLGGGGAKRLSHIGALKALAEYNIKLTHISGASMGAIISVLYASGYNIDDMINMAKHLGWKQILSDRWDFFEDKKKGLLNTKYLNKVLTSLRHNHIEDLTIPTRVSISSIRARAITSSMNMEISSHSSLHHLGYPDFFSCEVG